MKAVITTVIGALLLLTTIVFAQPQERDSIIVPMKKGDAFDALENDAKMNFGGNQTNFSHWSYSKKKHALVFYYGSISQVGFNPWSDAFTVNHDLGFFYRGTFIDREDYRLRVHANVEQNSLLAGDSPKVFSEKLGMFSVTHANEAEGHEDPALRYIYIENMLFDELIDISCGKIDPLFLTTFTPYGSWDRMTFINKSASSEAVPPIGEGFGVFTDFNITENFSIGALVIDNNPRNEVLDIGNFFHSTSYAYQGFIGFAIPTHKNLYSYHSASYYYVDPEKNKKSGQGFTYVGNQGVNDRLILTFKAMKGYGRVEKYNGAYSVGSVWLHPFDRDGDMLGVAAIMNEKAGKVEYGFDSFYKFYVKEWITLSANLQGIYGYSNRFNTIAGIRLMVSY